jgi:flagellar biosynthesis protein FliP
MPESTAGRIIAIIALIALVFMIFMLTPTGRAAWNRWFFDVQKADDATRYSTIKTVEDTCRAMMSSYTADKLAYEQYKGSDDKQKQSWAEQAKMRANKTAATYNNYILKSSFVWEGNVPYDIDNQLGYLK